MNKTLYLIRHGLTDWNTDRKMQGHTNIPLNETGKSQALSLRLFFKQHPVEQVFSSDLDRAFETAQLATKSENILKMAGLREVRLGEIEGQTELEITAQYGQKAWLQWVSLEPQANFAFPGGETHKESLQRFLQNLQHIVLNHQFKTAAICTHGLIIRRLAHHLRPDQLEPLPIPNCGVFKLSWKDQRFHFEGLVFNP